MSVWQWLLATVIGGGAVAGLVAWWHLRRRSRAGIHTSALARLILVGFGATRMSMRLALRKLRRLFLSEARRRELDRSFHDETARAAVATMGNMKGALMKLGQIVSFMDESLPPAMQEHLRKLQSQAPPMNYETVARVVEDELGRAPEELFSRFDRDPLAAASIGQVHRARLRDGTDVVVKVQYPGVDEAIAADLKNVGFLMTTIGALTPTLDAAPIANELRERLLEELDYNREAANQAAFRELFDGDDDIVIPRVFPELSSHRVLVSEFIDGLGFYEFVATAAPESRRRAVLAIRKFVFDSIWFHCVFNGDPHPGNYLFMPDGRVAFVDFGCVKHFDPDFIQNFKVLNRAYLEGDRDGYYAQAKAMNFIIDGQEHKVDRDWLWEFVSWFYEPILEKQPFHFTAEYCRKSVAQVFGANMRKVNMPPDYLMLNRITFGLNSIMAKLDACEDWRELSLPYYY